MILPLKMLIYLCAFLLPAIQFYRDWKHHDKRTKHYRKITVGLIGIWALCGVIWPVVIWHESQAMTQLTEKVDILMLRNEECIGESNTFRKYGLVATLNPLGFEVQPGDGFVGTTPISQALQGAVEYKSGKFLSSCGSLQEEQYKALMMSKPEFPFSYYFLAKCLQQRNDDAWKDVAQNAIEIFQITTQVNEHNESHDQALGHLLQAMNGRGF